MKNGRVDPYALAVSQHRLSRSHGFYGPTTNVGERIALIHSEVSELLETYRDKPTAPCPKHIEFAGRWLSCEEEEMADVLLRLTDLAMFRGVDIFAAAKAKHEYNKTRPLRHGRKF